MNYYEKTLLSVYKSLDGVINQMEHIIKQKARNSYYDYTPCEIQAENILKIVKDCRDKNGATVVMVSHSMDDIALIADRILVMNKGSVFMFDTVHNVFSNSEKLMEIGLNIPNITKVFVELKKQGISFPDSVYTMDDAVKAILSYANGREK
jgi:energy-coupling factor transport system ATP-binding protein